MNAMIKRLLVPLSILALLAGTPAAAEDEGGLISSLEALAEAGNGEAAYHLGMIYHLGLEGVTRDPQRAFDFFRQSARIDPLGAYKLGCFYAGQGEGVVEDNVELALRYKLIAAEQGYALAQQDVAQHYLGSGKGAEALRWLEAAGRQGSMESLALLAMIHTGAMQVPGIEADRSMALVAGITMLNRLPGTAERSKVERGMRAELNLNAEELARAEARLADWFVGPSELTVRADAGLQAAHDLAATF